MCWLVAALFLMPLQNWAQEKVVWRETFEGNANAWDPDRGVWDFGEPTNPAAPKPIEGRRCASVGLRSNYPANVNSAIIRHASFVVPPASQNPRIRFSHWYSIYLGDYGQVRIRVEGGAPQPLSERFDANSDWSRASLSLEEYAGKSVEIEFYFHSDSGNSGGGTAPGWFIDDIAFVVGERVFDGFEGFECSELWSFNPWTSTRGGWQLGTPAIGPRSAHEGTNCAGVVLKGGYPALLSSSLVSPAFVVPNADQHPRLRFSQWFSIYLGDFGQVMIREKGGTNEPLSETFDANSGWARTSLALEKYSGKEVQIEFYFYSNSGNTGGGIAAGWFIDEVELRTGDYEFRGKETFEHGWEDWYSTRGNWQIGTPASGPGAAHEGTNCAAVVLKGGYPAYASSSLVSPPFLVPPSDQSPRLRFYHWYSIYSGDYGQVLIHEVGSTNQSLSERYSGNSDWSRAGLPLNEFAGKLVQLEFLFRSDSGNPGGGTAAGWFIDEVEILPALPNRWPVLQPVASQIGRVGLPVSFVAAATDPDGTQSVTFSIDSSTKPENAIIDPVTGVFTWVPAPAQAATSTHFVRVRATDNGTPPRSDSRLVPIQIADGVRLYQSHLWEPRRIKVGGAVPGLTYTNYSVSRLRGSRVFPDSFPVTSLGEFVLRTRGECVPFANGAPLPDDDAFFLVMGDPASGN